MEKESNSGKQIQILKTIIVTFWNLTVFVYLLIFGLDHSIVLLIEAAFNHLLGLIKGNRRTCLLR